MKLTDTAVRKAQRAERPYKLADGGGLHLLVTPAGGKLWRYRYEVKGAEKTLAIGAYPAVSLADARKARDAAREGVAAGLDPNVAKRVRRADAVAEASATFAVVAERWYAAKSPLWSASHARDVRRNLDGDVIPAFGKVPVKAITARMVLALLREVEDRSRHQARKMRQQISGVFVHAIAEDLAETDPAAIIAPALMPVGEERHHPALTSLGEFRAMLQKVDSIPAFPLTRLALRLLALTAVRTAELRLARPEEFLDLDGPEPRWIIPKERMKGRVGKRRPHEVPLAPQSVELVKVVMAFTRGCPWLFPGAKQASASLSPTAMNAMLIRAGYEGRQTPHGMRSSFSTIMNERHAGNEQDRAIIDLMLAHKPKTGVEAVYNRASYKARRRELACEWADLISDGLMPAADVLRLPRSRVSSEK